jgi:hypothetical protein
MTEQMKMAETNANNGLMILSSVCEKEYNQIMKTRLWNIIENLKKYLMYKSILDRYTLYELRTLCLDLGMPNGYPMLQNQHQLILTIKTYIANMIINIQLHIKHENYSQYKF